MIKLGLRMVVMTLVVSGCEYVPGTDDYEMRTATEQVAQLFTDSESAKFKFVQMGRDNETVCGRVTARNAMGGYPEYQRFFASQLKSGSYLAFTENGVGPEFEKHFGTTWYRECETSMTKEHIEEMLKLYEDMPS